MAVLKCKMCGGDLNVSGGEKIVECEFCGTTQTVPTSSDENLQGLFNRANVLRMKSEFNKAEQMYEKIIQKDETQAEAYWGLILCKYGIEYVEDPTSFKRIPTCHRTSFESVTADEDFKSALTYADAIQKDIYEAEAKEIDRLQKEILALSEKEEPYDVFICYKETDSDGKRTQDSVIANDIYHQLTQEGLKVFYAAITLEDKLGSSYEPYIFAALNSSKVMLVIGTKPEYFNAVWVKNEWSRYLKLIQKDRTKTLIPCYRDMDAYELPEEFAHLQAQDMSKIGFINDVVRGIKKVVAPEVKETPVAQTQVIENANSNVQALLDRGFMALEDSEWQKADDFFEQALNFDAKLAKAYLGKLMAEKHIRHPEKLRNLRQPYDDSPNYQKVLRFADDDLKNKLTEDIAYMVNRNKMAELESLYKEAIAAMSDSTDADGFWDASDMFEEIKDYKDSAELARQCREKAEIAEKDDILKEAESLLDDSHTWQGKDTDIDSYTKMIEKLETIKDYKDADKKIVACKNKIEEIKKQQEEKRIAEENARIEQERKAEEKRILKKKKIKKITMISTPILCAIIAFVIVLNTIIIPSMKYNKANALLDEKKYTEAFMTFSEISAYKDSSEKAKVIRNQNLTLKSTDGIIAIGNDHTVGLKADGTVVATGDNRDGQCNVDDWKDIVAVFADYNLTLGIKSDGEVVRTGENRTKNWYPSRWTDIVSISTGDMFTAILNADGTVDKVTTTYEGGIKGEYRYSKWNNVLGWENIVAISDGFSYTVGLKSDGTVVTDGDNEEGECNVSDWRDIVAISTGLDHTVGLKADGTVVATGMNGHGQCDVSDWKDIVAILAGSQYTVGLKADGTVVATGVNGHGQCDVSDWSGIVAIFAGGGHTVGLKADGTVIATGRNDDGQCDVKDWNLFE